MLIPTATALCLQALWKELEDHHAVAAAHHGDTPEQHHHSRQTRTAEVKSQA
jgi:hypothetical protein